MSYLITIFKNEESVVLRPRDAINCNSRDLFQIRQSCLHQALTPVIDDGVSRSRMIISMPSAPWGLMTQQRFQRSEEGSNNSKNSSQGERVPAPQRSDVRHSWRKVDTKDGSR